MLEVFFPRFVPPKSVGLVRLQKYDSEFSIASKVSGNVKECLEGQAKLSARIDDLCDALVKEARGQDTIGKRSGNQLDPRGKR